MSLRHGVCRIASNDGDGAYTITERYWDASSEAWRDADAPFGFVGADALELNGNACGPASSEPIPFWEERDDAGTVRRFIHLTGFGTGGYRVVAINAHYSGTNTAQFQSIGGVLYARVIVSIQIRQCSGNGAAATHPTYTTGAPENYGGGVIAGTVFWSMAGGMDWTSLLFSAWNTAGGDWSPGGIDIEAKIETDGDLLLRVSNTGSPYSFVISGCVDICYHDQPPSGNEVGNCCCHELGTPPAVWGDDDWQPGT